MLRVSSFQILQGVSFVQLMVAGNLTEHSDVH